VIAAGEDSFLNKAILSRPVVVGLGLISYALYLWHWPILSFLRIIAENEKELALPVLVIAMLSSVGLAWTTYLFVERPIRRSSNKAKSAAVLFAVTLAIGAFGIAIWANRGFEGRPGIAQKADAQFTGTTWQEFTNKDCLQRFPVPDTGQYSWWFCVVSAPAPPTVVVLGNSYANHLYTGLVQALPHQTVLSDLRTRIYRAFNDLAHTRLAEIALLWPPSL
jgi:hypothetical protein